jgi:hypothetical protein
MNVQNEGSSRNVRDVAPIGAALTPGLVSFWSPKRKRLSAASRSPLKSNPSASSPPKA